MSLLVRSSSIHLQVWVWLRAVQYGGRCLTRDTVLARRTLQVRLRLCRVEVYLACLQVLDLTGGVLCANITAVETAYFTALQQVRSCG